MILSRNQGLRSPVRVELVRQGKPIPTGQLEAISAALTDLVSKNLPSDVKELVCAFQDAVLAAMDDEAGASLLTALLELDKKVGQFSTLQPELNLW